MLPPDQTGVPLSITAGDTVVFSITHADYTPSNCVLTFVLAQMGQVALSVQGSAADDGVSWIFTVNSGLVYLNPGQYTWTLLSKSLADGTRTTVQRSDIWVWPDPALSLPETPAQTILANMLAALTALSSKTKSMVNINGQSFTVLDIEKLQKAIREQRSIVQAELRRLGILKNGAQKKLVTRFSA
jgi:hypothetical protein